MAEDNKSRKKKPINTNKENHKSSSQNKSDNEVTLDDLFDESFFDCETELSSTPEERGKPMSRAQSKSSDALRVTDAKNIVNSAANKTNSSEESNSSEENNTEENGNSEKASTDNFNDKKRDKVSDDSDDTDISENQESSENPENSDKSDKKFVAVESNADSDRIKPQKMIKATPDERGHDRSKKLSAADYEGDDFGENVGKRFEQVESRLGETFNTWEQKFIDSIKEIMARPKLLAGMVLGVMVIVFLLYFFLSPRFRVSSIAISGNYVLSQDDIIAMIDVNYGDHIYKGIDGNILDIIKLDYGKTEQRIIEKYPYVEDIKIHADFPSRITVTVTERAKVACIKLTDGFATVDTNGIVVDLNLSNDNIEDFNPVICGLEVSHVTLGERIVISNDDDYRKAVIILGAVLAADVNNVFPNDYSFYEGLHEIRILPSGLIYLTFKLPSGSFLQVKLESLDTINDDMNWLVLNVRENSFEDFPDGALDMTGERYVYRQY